MDMIDVKDLPEPFARALETMVKALREQLTKKNGSTEQPVTLPQWKGHIQGNLSRDEIYEDAV